MIRVEARIQRAHIETSPAALDLRSIEDLSPGVTVPVFLRSIDLEPASAAPRQEIALIYEARYNGYGSVFIQAALQRRGLTVLACRDVEVT